jgi:hypothetical protein
MWCGRPENSRNAHTIASSGLVMQITKAPELVLDALADRLHHLEVDAEQIVAAHAGLAGDAGGDDDDVGTRDIGIIVGAGDLGIETLDRAALGKVQRLALGTPSTMSNRTTSPSSFCAARWASVPPMLPAPMRAIFLRAMGNDVLQRGPMSVADEGRPALPLGWAGRRGISRCDALGAWAPRIATAKRAKYVHFCALQADNSSIIRKRVQAVSPHLPPAAFAPI